MSFRIKQVSDVVMAAFVVAITAMLLVPLPTWLIDFLLATNLGLSLLILLVGLYTSNSLALLSFPSILLLTTLFRLSLDVACTRLILTQADAGRVIEAFGTFLIQGEIGIGLVIFSIITIVNFIVIARGSARVSEVAARFTLDALPGKQMAIDADLRTGLISTTQAQERRERLRQESQLYGSMDGAMKFVQGDAVAGFFIILTNIFGGLYVGLSSGLGFAESINTYTVLTVGDGLVHQIPALLISVCAGIVVTRVSSTEGSTLGADVSSQVFKRPGMVAISGAALIFVGLLPGIPKLPFLLVGALLIAIAIMIFRSKGAEGDEVTTDLPLLHSLPSVLALSGGSDSSDPDRLMISLDTGVLYKVFLESSGSYTEYWSRLREDFFKQTGLRLPDLAVSPDPALSVGQYTTALDSVIDSGRVPLDALLVEVNPDSASVFGLDLVQDAEHPLTKNRVFWARRGAVLEQVLEAGSVRTIDFLQFILLRAVVYFHEHPEDILTLADVHQMVKEVEKKYPGLISEGFGGSFLSASRLTELFHGLVKENISIKDHKQLFELVATYCSRNGLSPSNEDNFDLGDLISFIRVSRRRQLLTGLLSDRQSLRVITLTHTVEDIFDQARSESPTQPVALASDTFQSLRENLRLLTEPTRAKGLNQPAILCRSDLRLKVSGFVKACRANLPVIAFDELEPTVTVESIGAWVV